MLDIITTLLKYYTLYELELFYVRPLLIITPYKSIINTAIILNNLFLGYMHPVVHVKIYKPNCSPLPVCFNHKEKYYTIDNFDITQKVFGLVSAAEFILYINNNVKNIEDILIQKYMELI